MIDKTRKTSQKKFFCTNCILLCRKLKRKRLRIVRASLHLVWARKGQFSVGRACSSWYSYCYIDSICISFACHCIISKMHGRKKEEAFWSDQISEKFPELLRLAIGKAMEMYIPVVKISIANICMRLIPTCMLCTTHRMENDAKPDMAGGANIPTASPDG